ncbi:MAG: ribonuclease HII, partial [Candidatus Aenigmatarchaeota archaeon]
MLKMTLALGIDEAGRGCVIGPLVVCGALIDESDESRLRKINVKDSKMLSPSQRERIKPEIEKIAKWFHVAKIEPEKIDGKSQHGLNLNELETVKFA